MKPLNRILAGYLCSRVSWPRRSARRRDSRPERGMRPRWRAPSFRDPCFDGNECTTNDLCDNVGHCNQGTAVASGTACGDPTSSALRVLNESFFGPGSVTHVLAPNATVRVGLAATYDGALCGRDLKGAWRVALSCTDTAAP